MASTARALWPALLLVVCAAMAVAAQAQDLPGGLSVKPLSSFPACQGPQGTALPPGLKGCKVDISNLQGSTQDVALFSFALDRASAMTINIRLTTLNGQSQMGLLLPGQTLSSTITIVGQDIFQSQGHHYETAIYLAPNNLDTWAVGNYTIVVQALSRQPMMTLTVSTTANTVSLHPYEQSKMSEMFAQCCPTDATGLAAAAQASNGAFCTQIAPLAAKANHTWDQDLCHQPLNECDQEGQLTRLILQDSGLQCKGFPAALGELRQLAALDLSGNSIADTVANAAAVLATNNAPLEELYLFGVGLTGPLDCGIAASPRKVLDLRNNAVSGSLPACMFSGTLAEVHLNNNAMGGALPDVTGPSNLTALFAGDQSGGFTGAVPASLSGLATLQYLDLTNSALNDGFAGPISDSVMYLVLPGNNMTGSLPNLPKSANIVDLRGNLLGGDLPDVAPLQQLQQLYISAGNSFTGTISALPDSLQVLRVRGNQLSGALPPLPPNMVWLDVSGNSFTGDISTVNFTNYQIFLANGQQFSGSLGDTVANAPNLDQLSLVGSGISGPLPQQWGTPALSLLDLSSNALTGTIPATLAQQPQLISLSLSNNKLSGNLDVFAAAIIDSSPLVNLTLAENQLTGSVPAGLQKLGVFTTTPIITLSLVASSGTAASESVPRVMVLTDNNLSGTFPSFLITNLSQAFTACQCSMLIGVDTTLTCPPTMRVTDQQWEFAGTGASTFYCTDTARNAIVPISNFLVSPMHNATNSIMDPNARQGANELGSFAAANSSPSGASTLSAGGIAGVVIAAVVVSALAAALLIWVQKRRHAYGRGRSSFRHQQDEQLTDLNGHAAAVSGLPTSKSMASGKDIEMGPDNRAVL